MNHFGTRLTSPVWALSSGVTFIIVSALILSYKGYFNTETLRWGPPLILFGKVIESQSEFYLMLLIFFCHQLINNWISDVVYPWIINCVQDPKTQLVGYSDRVALILLNIYSVYSELDLFLMLAGFSSQISFVVVIILANFITTTIINNRYLKAKAVIISDIEDYSPV